MQVCWSSLMMLLRLVPVLAMCDVIEAGATQSISGLSCISPAE
jgi:hypothetical protein